MGKLGEQDEAELEVTFNRRTGARRARAIRLVDRAGARRELGQARTYSSSRFCPPRRFPLCPSIPNAASIQCMVPSPEL